jgi:hypothetical protein
MGKLGNTERNATVLAHAKRDGFYHLPFPKEVSDRISWLAGDDEVTAWLLLLECGRFRILSDEEVKNDLLLEPIRALVLGGQPRPTRSVTEGENSAIQSLVARLLPIRIDRRRRIAFPRELDAFVPPDCELTAFSFLLSLEGFWELWYTDVLRSTVNAPSPLLSGIPSRKKL